ncbi:DUF932 domain-containing protein [Aquabacterium sp.]|uniref:DUF932 domain-containing protein n=1 Tax=Aquabacterium sp. TaxID=1872578 RepID=UPI0040381889
MAHLVNTMAYVGEAPWHQLGNQLATGQSIEVWTEQAGMNWRIEEAPVQYFSDAEQRQRHHTFEGHKVLYRSDTQAPLSVVGEKYKVVQPQQVMEFYRDLTEVSGYELETAGVLKEGKKLWALARTGQQATLKGGDTVRGYLLLATSCDGTLATIATPTTVRVVCNNTLSVALKGADSGIKVPHSTAFDAQAVKKRLGIAVGHWDSFMYEMKQLSERKVKSKEVERFFERVFSYGSPDAKDSTMRNERAIKRAHQLFGGHGRGAELAAAKGTAWGLLNAVTEYVDHERRAKSTDHRIDSSWFGLGSTIKQNALDEAMALVG